MHLRLSVQLKPFDDVRVRHAFALAIDRETLCNKVLPGIGQPAYQFLPPNLLGHDGEIGRELAFDPAHGRELLAAAGYPDGKDMPLIYWQYEQNETYQTMFEALQAMLLEHLGVRTELAPTEAGARAGLARAAPAAPALLPPAVGRGLPRPAQLHGRALHHPAAPGRHLEDDAGADLQQRRRSTRLVWQAAKEQDPVRRAELYQRCEQILVIDDPAIIPLYYALRHRLIKPDRAGADHQRHGRAVVAPGSAGRLRFWTQINADQRR